MNTTRRALVALTAAVPAFAALPFAGRAAATPQDPMIDALAEMTRRIMPGDRAAALAVLRGNPGSEPRDPAVAAYRRWHEAWHAPTPDDERDGIDAVYDAVDARFDAFHNLATTTPTTIEGVGLQLDAHATVMGDSAQLSGGADAKMIETMRDALARLGAAS